MYFKVNLVFVAFFSALTSKLELKLHFINFKYLDDDEEEGKSEPANGFIVGKNLPFNHCLNAPKSTDEEFKLLAHPDLSAKFQWVNLPFNFLHNQQISFGICANGV